MTGMMREYSKSEKYQTLGLIGTGLLLGVVAWLLAHPLADRLLLLPAVLFIGSGTAKMGYLGLRTGCIYSRSGYGYRDDQPFYFWMLVTICLAGGLFMLLAGLIKLFGIEMV